MTEETTHHDPHRSEHLRAVLESLVHAVEESHRHHTPAVAEALAKAKEALK